MPSLNQILLIGRLTRADRNDENSTNGAELRYTDSGRPVVRFRLAVDRPGTDQADFFDVIWWGPAAEADPDGVKRKRFEQHVHYLRKGRLVLVKGRMQSRTYETQDGLRRQVWEVHVGGAGSQVVYLDRLPDEVPPLPDEDEAVPF